LSQQLYASQAAPNGASANGHVSHNGNGHKPTDEGEVIEGEFTEA
jgi:hypothetical protein